jgi:hypothetical protein
MYFVMQSRTSTGPWLTATPAPDPLLSPRTDDPRPHNVLDLQIICDHSPELVPTNDWSYP